MSRQQLSLNGSEHERERDKLLQELAACQSLLQQHDSASQAQITQLSTEIERLASQCDQQNSALAQLSANQAHQVAQLEAQLVSAQKQLKDFNGQREEEERATVQQLLQVLFILDCCFSVNHPLHC